MSIVLIIRSETFTHYLLPSLFSYFFLFSVIFKHIYSCDRKLQKYQKLIVDILTEPSSKLKHVWINVVFYAFSQFCAHILKGIINYLVVLNSFSKNNPTNKLHNHEEDT